MPRLIDADAFRAELFKMAHMPISSQTSPTSWAVAYSSFIMALDRLPTIYCPPVVHGEWIRGQTLKREWMKCSLCHVSQTPNGCFSFCPNCGAKMDKEGNNG